MSFSL
ncbi:hypothetical protein D027_1744A, partial [Vibrio parahaemolyticus 861]